MKRGVARESVCVLIERTRQTHAFIWHTSCEAFWNMNARLYHPLEMEKRHRPLPLDQFSELALYLEESFPESVESEFSNRDERVSRESVARAILTRTDERHISSRTPA